MSENHTNNLLQQLKEVFGELAGRDLSAADPRATFFELGFDSLLLTQVASALKKRFGVKITFRQLLEELTTFEAIAGSLEKLMPAGMAPAPSPAKVKTAAELPSGAPLAGSSGVTASASQIFTSSDGSSGNSVLERVIKGQMALMTRQLEILHGKVESQATEPRPVSAKNGQSSSKNQTVDDLKRFGPFKGIAIGPKGGLTPRQEQSLKELTVRYNRRTAGSKAYAQQHRAHFCDPRAAGNFRQIWKEMVYPIVCAKSQGGKIWDIDGNEYVDLTLGFGANYFGHAPDFVVKAVSEQLHKGFEIGPQSPLAGEAARILCEMTGMERATFCNTGSEAVMAAIRVARTVTGRDKIVHFTGDYHGIFDEVLAHAGTVAGQPGALPIAPGIPPLANVIVLEYGHPDSLEVIRSQADEIAAVLVEPVQSRHPDKQPREFLHLLRQLTTEKDIALVFDEVVTGFRVAPGGAQEYFGVRADLASYGKVVGGGMPIGVLAGSRRFMDALDGGAWQFGDSSFPEVGVTFFAGTFVRHPLAMAAAHATLLYLQQAGPELQRQTTAKTAQFVRRLNDHFQSVEVPIRLQTFGSGFYYDFHPDLKFGGLLFYYLRDRGVHIWEGRVGQICTVHTAEELDFVFQAFTASVEEMQAAGFLPGRESGAAAGPTRVALTEAQREIWISTQMGSDANCSYNESCSLHFQGALDCEKFLEALRQLVNRHDVLRCRFSADGEYQEFYPELRVELPVRDLASQAPAPQAGEVAAIIARDMAQPFNLVAGPMCRFQMLKLAADRHQFIFTAHHAVCDGWSFGVLFQELSELYTGLVEGKPKVLKPAMQFREYAEWCAAELQTTEATEAEAFWMQKFPDPNVPVLELPYDRPRPALKSYNGSLAVHRCDPETFRQFRQTSGQMGQTLFTNLFAAFLALLHRFSGQTDIVVGIPAAGQALVGSNDLVGHCLNFLPTRNRVDRTRSYSALAAGLKKEVLDAFEHQNYTYGTLVRKLKLPNDASRLPLLSVMFNLEKSGFDQLRFAGLETSVTTNPKAFVNFDLFANLVQSDHQLDIQCEFNTDLFDRETVMRWLGHFETLIRAVAVNPTLLIGDIPLLNPAEQQRLLIEWNQTRRDYPRTATIHALFEAQARKTPDKVAVRCGEQTLTYQALDRAADALAEKLLGLGVKVGDLVGLCLERSTDLVVTVLGILKSGAAYVPMDPAFPASRLACLVEDAHLPVIVTASSLLSKLPPHKSKILCVDKIEAGSSPGGLRREPAAGDHLAYVIFTSGSTGRPKGVQIQHRAVVNFLNSMRREPGIRPEDVLLSVTTLSFDIAGLEIFLPLTSGAALVIATQETVADGKRLREELETRGITFMQATPVTWTLLLEAGWAGHPALKLLCGGEALPSELAKQLISRCGSLWNMYGPTETTIWSTLYRVSQAGGPILVGRPIDNTQLYVVDEGLQPAPVGIPGELLIGGDGVAVGYLGQPELTAEKFIPNPFAPGSGSRLYRTGDVARYQADGNLDLLGRLDHQVKLRGFRIELGEIESVFRKHPLVKDCVVVLREKVPGQKRLIGYVTLRMPGDQPATGGNSLSDHWRDQWEKTYRAAVQEAEGKSESFQNIDTIINSWTGLENNAAQTTEWIEATIGRLKQLQPSRVLEVGCGTGQLMLRLAPQTEFYWGTDFSLAAIEGLRSEADKRELRNVTLLHRTAPQLDDIPLGKFDLYILNSVSQYFPDPEYLAGTIERGATTLAPGGRMFIGDVQSHALLECYHSAAQLKAAPDHLTVEQIRGRVSQRVAQEAELVVDPKFFLALRQRVPRIKRVDIQLRRGRFVNETTQYHYDAILYLDQDVKVLKVPNWVDWSGDQLTIQRLRTRLEVDKPNILGIRAVPNGRLLDEINAFQSLKAARPNLTVAELRKGMPATMPGIEPEDLWVLGDALGYHVDIRWSGSGINGQVDVVFSRPEVRGPACVTDLGEGRESAAGLAVWANNPARHLLLGKIQDSLITQVRSELPEYMVPSAIVALEELPRTPNGKINRQALPEPVYGPVGDQDRFVAPRNDREKALADIWSEVLRLDKVSVLDSFFDLGGESLLSFRVASRASQAGIPITPRMIFQHKTIAGLIQAVESEIGVPAAKPALRPIARIPRRAGAAISTPEMDDDSKPNKSR